MTTLRQLEQEALRLTTEEREHFVLTMWDSLEGNVSLDPEGIRIALDRDRAMEDGSVQSINHAEFHQLTRGTK